MSQSLNKVFLLGNLTRDPEVKVTPSGVSLTKFGLATNESWVDKSSGEKKEVTTFHNIDCWGKQAEFASAYLRKGKPALIEGKIENREYTDQAGVKKTASSIRCQNITLIGRRDEGAAPEPKPAAEEGGYDSDLPF